MKIPYLTAKKLASGKVSYYLNIPSRLLPEGCKIKSSTPLGDDYISACQKGLEIYKTLKDSRKNKEILLNPKTLNYLWKEYQQSRFYIDLAERTKKDYNRCYMLLEPKENKSGKKLIDTELDLFDSDSAYNLYLRFVETHKTRWAKNLISFMRLLYNFGMRKEIFLRQNPFCNLRIKSSKPQKLFIPQEHINILINKAREMNLDNVALAIELNFYICQRPADVLKLRKSDMYEKGGNYFFNIVQNKTKANVHVPIPRHILPEILKKDDFIICNNNQKPYDVNSFGRMFKKVNDACGFNYTFRLLRHSGSTAYAEAGVNTSAIISLTGHTDEKIFNTTYKGNSEQLSLYALNKRLESEKQEN